MRTGLCLGLQKIVSPSLKRLDKIMIFPTSLPQFAEATLANLEEVRLRQVEGGYEIDSWPTKRPTLAEVLAWQPEAKPAPVDHQAEVEEALTVAKSGPTVAKTLSLVERLVARVADLEKRIGL
jgi:hypothetical protein